MLIPIPETRHFPKTPEGRRALRECLSEVSRTKAGMLLLALGILAYWLAGYATWIGGGTLGPIWGVVLTHSVLALGCGAFALILGLVVGLLSPNVAEGSWFSRLVARVGIYLAGAGGVLLAVTVVIGALFL